MVVKRFDNICPRCGERPRREIGDGYCAPCSTKHTAEWRAKNLEHRRKVDREWANKKKNDIYDKYGGKCQCCGETNRAFFTIDHINGGGNKERKFYQSQTWKLVIKRNYPDDYQILCYNCNNAKYKLGVCPHQLGSKSSKSDQ